MDKTRENFPTIENWDDRTSAVAKLYDRVREEYRTLQEIDRLMDVGWPKSWNAPPSWPLDEDAFRDGAEERVREAIDLLNQLPPPPMPPPPPPPEPPPDVSDVVDWVTRGLRPPAKPSAPVPPGQPQIVPRILLPPTAQRPPGESGTGNSGSGGGTTARAPNPRSEIGFERGPSGGGAAAGGGGGGGGAGGGGTTTTSTTTGGETVTTTVGDGAAVSTSSSGVTSVAFSDGSTVTTDGQTTTAMSADRASVTVGADGSVKSVGADGSATTFNAGGTMTTSGQTYTASEGDLEVTYTDSGIPSAEGTGLSTDYTETGTVGSGGSSGEDHPEDPTPEQPGPPDPGDERSGDEGTPNPEGGGGESAPRGYAFHTYRPGGGGGARLHGGRRGRRGAASERIGGPRGPSVVNPNPEDDRAPGDHGEGATATAEPQELAIDLPGAGATGMRFEEFLGEQASALASLISSHVTGPSNDRGGTNPRFRGYVPDPESTGGGSPRSRGYFPNPEDAGGGTPRSLSARAARARGTATRETTQIAARPRVVRLGASDRLHVARIARAVAGLGAEAIGAGRTSRSGRSGPVAASETIRKRLASILSALADVRARAVGAARARPAANPRFMSARLLENPTIGAGLRARTGRLP